MVTQVESDILECEVKWTLGSITMNTASGGDELPTELFQILKETAALNMPANLENSSGHRPEKGQFSFQFQRRAMPKYVQTTVQLHSFHMSMVRLKILQVILQ